MSEEIATHDPLAISIEQVEIFQEACILSILIHAEEPYYRVVTVSLGADDSFKFFSCVTQKI